MLLSTIARLLLGSAMLLLGLQHLLIGDLFDELAPAARELSNRQAIAYVWGTGLTLAAGAVLVGRFIRIAAPTLIALIALWVVALCLPRLLVAPSSVGTWVATFEWLTIAAGLAVLARHESADGSLRTARIVDALGTGARAVVGAGSVAFGIVHLLYPQAIAGLIPQWIPAAIPCAYVTGALRILAGVALIVGLKVRLTATLLAAMYASWIAIVHVPRLLTAGDRSEWTFVFLALALCGSAVALAAEEKRSAGSAPLRELQH